MLNLSMVFIGGGFGALCRYGLSMALNNRFFENYPVGTIAANLTGTLIIGFISVLVAGKNENPYLRELVTIGFLGGLTTFSTFTQEALVLFENSRYLALAIYLVANLVLGMGLLILGRKLGSL